MKVHSNPQRSNSTLLLVQAHGEADPALKRHWPWLMKSGCDIVVTSPEDDPSSFEGPVAGQRINDPPKDFWKLQARAVEVLSQLPASPLVQTYNGVMLLPYDCVFLKPLKHLYRIGLETRIDESKENFTAPFNMTPPWRWDWMTLDEFLEATRRHPVDFEQGFMDRWVAALAHLHGIKHHQTGLIGYAANSVDDKWAEVEVSIRAGLPLVHGIKTKDQLWRVLECAHAANVL